MKRYVILLCVLLCCLMLKAQSVTYTCRYWFDQNHAQAATVSFSDSTWQADLDVGLLTAGIHKLCLQVADTSMKWSSPQTYLFFKTLDTLQEDLTCRYWFDQNHSQMQHLPFGNGNLLLNVDDLEDGLHTVNIFLESEKLTTTQNYSFVKVAVVGQDTLDMSNLLYHCWFDQDFEHRQTDSIGDGHFLLDVSELEDGLHTVNVLIEGDALTTTTRYVFVKLPVGNPSSEYQYHCWFDNDFSTMQTGGLGLGCFQLDVDGLTNGFHTVSVQLDDNGTLSAPLHYMFYKRPFGGYITKWEYWLNGDTDNRHTTDLSPYVDTLDIITLLPLETWPIRSTCFHFQPNGDEPYIIAKNEITFRFWDVDKHFFDKSSFYIDENIVEPIVADSLERNTTVSIDAPRDNQIRWFKLDVGRGDFLSFQADKACTMQLFAPSGEEVYSASGPESIELRGFNVWEDGTYYLAVHDVTGSGETVSVTYNWLNRYTILSYDVHLVGNGGCSTVTFQGNGFNSLLNVYLVNYQNDTIRQMDIGHECNTSTTVSFNFYQENLGTYDAVFEFFEETIRINGALEVQEPVDIVLTSTVSYPSAFLRNTPCTYTYTITNNGNMTAYNVPVYVYIGTEDMNGLYSIRIDGLEIQSYYDCVKDLYEWSELEKKNIKEYSDLVGVDYCFLKSVDIGDNEVDSVLIRSGYFYLEIPPYTTRTISLRLISYTNVDTWFSCPNEWLPIIEQENRWMFFDSSSRSSQSDFCCWHTTLEGALNIISIISSGASIILQLKAASDLGAAAVAGATAIIPDPTSPSAVALAGAGVMSAATMQALSLFASYISCASSTIAETISGTANDLCNGELKTGDRVVSVSGILIDCITSVLGYFFPSMGYVSSISSIGMGAWSLWHIWRNKNPYCENGNSKGGKALAVISFDPNDIHGYLSEAGSHYMRQEIQNVQYEIEFENDTTLATAAAHTIIVRDTLDATKFDLNSLAARSVTIGDKRLDLNGEQTFARTLDLRPEIYVIAQINQDYDPTTGIIQWTIQSLDPMTMEPTNDPNQGVLPVNFYGDGVGFIDYSVNLRGTFADGTAISNRAGIIFDQNDVIMTPTWTNIIDAVKPTSHIESVTPLEDSLAFNFVSSDNSSGVWYHTLYYRNDSTAQEWQVRKAQIFENSFKLHLEDFLTTEYLVMAVDSAGNHEEKNMVAEYVFVASIAHFITAGTWSTASNWQDGALPGTNDAVFIDAPCQLNQNAKVGTLTVSDGQTLTLQSGQTLTVSGSLTNTATSGLVIKDGAQLVNASGNVQATMEKNVVAYGSANPNGWYTIASPMEAMPIAGSSFLTPEYDLYRYNESSINAEWENYKDASNLNFTTFENGRGYLYANSNTFSPVFTGTLNVADVDCSLTYSERPDGLSGFNLIGNPFPHDIYKGAGAAIDNANLASGYYTLTNEGSWRVHTYEDAIVPGQGVLVKAATATDLTIAKTRAMATAENGGSKAAMGRMGLSVVGANGHDKAFAYFGQGDGLNKVDNFAEQAPRLWIRANGNNYAIAHLDKQTETMEVVFSNNQSGTFTLTVNSNDLSFSYLHLIDHVTGADMDLLQQPDYTFQATGQEQHFVLVFRWNTSVGENQQQTFCFVKDKMLYINTESQCGHFALTDVMGRTVKSGEVKSCIDLTDLQSGLYIVRLIDGYSQRVQKIVVD